MKKSAVIALFILALTFSARLASSRPAVVLIEGTVKEAKSGKPVGTKIVFVDPEGKKKIAASNAKDGKFQLPLVSGKTYDVFFKGYVAARGNEKISLPERNSYSEKQISFYVENFKKGVVLFEDSFFEPNKAEIKNSESENLKYLANFLSVNPSAPVVVKISSIDSWLKTKYEKKRYIDRRGRKRTKRVKVRTKELLNRLLDKRIENFRKFLASKKIYLKKSSFVKDLKVVPPRKKRKRKKVGRRYKYYIPKFNEVTVQIGE